MSATGANPPVLTYAEVKARKTRRTITHFVHTDDDAVVALRAADEALRKAKTRGEKADRIAELETELEQAKEAVRGTTLQFRLRALPREGERSYSVLKAEHPATDVDHERAREYSGDPKAKAIWSKATFGPALVAACLIEPVVTVDDATEMAADWNEPEWDGLLAAAIGVNQEKTDTAGLVFS